MGEIARRMHDCIKTYYDQAKRLHAQIEADKKTFIPSIAKTLKEKNESELSTGRTMAIDQIHIISRAAKDELMSWGKLQGSRLGEDAQLIYSGITPTTAEMRQLIERHKQNYTMLRMLADWWKAKHQASDGSLDEIGIELAQLTTYDTREQAIDRLTSDAISTIDSIYAPDPTDHVRASLMDRIIAEWGQRSEI